MFKNFLEIFYWFLIVYLKIILMHIWVVFKNFNNLKIHFIVITTAFTFSSKYIKTFLNIKFLSYSVTSTPQINFDIVF